MLRNVARMWPLAGVLIAGACQPGPIAPRRVTTADGAGAGSGQEVELVDGSTSVAPVVDAGAGGGGRTKEDAARVDAGEPATPGAPQSDAAGATTTDAAHGVSVDANGAAFMPDAGRAVTEDAGRATTVDGGAATIVDAGTAAATDASAGAAGSDAQASAGRAPRIGELVIDEVLVNPTGDDLGREWIEIENLGSDALDLSGLHLANATVDVGVAAGVIAPGGLRLLGQSADPTKNGGAPVEVAYGTKLILNNANGQLSICLGACASGVVLDTVSWGSLGDAYTGHALVIDPVGRQICGALAPFGTAGSFGTPGAPNPACGAGTDAAPGPDGSVAAGSVAN
jgi:lamin tail-like protein